MVNCTREYLSHTFAVNYLQNAMKKSHQGEVLKRLSEILGHSSITQTEQYAKVVPESLAIGIEELTQIL